MLTLRARIFVITSVIVLVILAISLALLIVRRNQNNQNTPPVTIDTQNSGEDATGTLPLITQPAQTSVVDTVPTGLEVKPRTSIEATQSGVKQLARIFVERFYTYSSDSNFQNINDVKGLVTARLWSDISKKLSTSSPKGTFTGVTTEVITISLGDWKENTVLFEVKARQSTTKGAGVATVSYVTYRVRMLKIDSSWLVDTTEIIM